MATTSTDRALDALDDLVEGLPSRAKVDAAVVIRVSDPECRRLLEHAVVLLTEIKARLPAPE